MLRSFKALAGRAVIASDGEIGRVADLLLDDERWTVRYLAVDAGGLVPGRQLLLSPRCLSEENAKGQPIVLTLSKEQLRGCPDVDADTPSVHPRESDYQRYYGYSSCWVSAGIWAPGGPPGPLSTAGAADASAAPATSHLRSATDVCGYGVEGADGAIGYVDDFLVEDDSWEVRWLVVATSRAEAGRRVLIAPHWAREIDWAKRLVWLELTHAAIELSPPWDGATAPPREYEALLHRHFGKQAYWGDDAPAFEAARRDDAGLGPEVPAA